MATEFRTAQLRTPDDGKFQLVGVAAGYNVESAPIPSGRGSTCREVIKPGAFRRALSGEGSDVKCLLNHDVNTVLGRQQNRTLELFDTKLGLGFTCQLNPESQAHRDLYASVQRGDINECSFGFNASPDGEEWKNVTDSRGKSYVRRTLTDVELYDVSVVTHPAYPNSATMVQARSSAAPPRRLRTPAIIEARKRARAESRRRGMCFEDLLQERKFLREAQSLRAKLESTAREI